MNLSAVKRVTLFKFTEDKGGQVNIYVEPTDEAKGRLIVCNANRIYQRFFDGCNPGIYAFLARQPVEAICSCFTDEDEDYEYAMKMLKDVWTLFIEHIKETHQLG